MVSIHDKYAKEYDSQIKEYDCYIADVLFGLSYEYIKKGEKLLDIGIGTGVSSFLFSKAGIRVSGIDGSREMLTICKTKGITEELIEQDLLVFPWPFHKQQFNHVICCGVFHFMGDLDQIFLEISHLHDSGGIFTFTIQEGKFFSNEHEKYKLNKEGEFNIFTHNLSYIYKLMQDNHYTKEKEIVVQVGETQFRTIAAKKE
jgi:predicted TPR repeat methyltransferase